MNNTHTEMYESERSTKVQGRERLILEVQGLAIPRVDTLNNKIEQNELGIRDM